MRPRPFAWLALAILLQLSAVMGLFWLSASLPGQAQTALTLLAVAGTSWLAARHWPTHPLLGGLLTAGPLIAYFLLVTAIAIEPLNRQHYFITLALVGAAASGAAVAILSSPTVKQPRG